MEPNMSSFWWEIVKLCVSAVIIPIGLYILSQNKAAKQASEDTKVATVKAAEETKLAAMQLSHKVDAVDTKVGTVSDQVGRLDTIVQAHGVELTNLRGEVQFIKGVLSPPTKQ